MEIHEEGPFLKTDEPLDDKFKLLELLTYNEENGY